MLILSESADVTNMKTYSTQSSWWNGEATVSGSDWI